MFMLLSAEGHFFSGNRHFGWGIRRRYRGRFLMLTVNSRHLAQCFIECEGLGFQVFVDQAERGQVVIETAAGNKHAVCCSEALNDHQHFLTQKFVQILSAHVRDTAGHCERDGQNCVHAEILFALHEAHFILLVRARAEFSAPHGSRTLQPEQGPVDIEQTPVSDIFSFEERRCKFVHMVDRVKTSLAAVALGALIQGQQIFVFQGLDTAAVQAAVEGKYARLNFVHQWRMLLDCLEVFGSFEHAIHQMYGFTRAGRSAQRGSAME